MEMNSKKAKVDHHVNSDVNSDRLSDLPLSIIHIILALIPIREAVRTSVLSTQWKYTWTTLNELVFDDECASRKHKSVSKSEFITRVLFRHKGPIHKFTLSCSDGFENIDEWIFCLSRNDIQKLILVPEDDDCTSVEMHSSIYSCKKLTYLSLYKCNLVPPPLNFKGFLFLRCLCLNTLGLSSDEINTFLSVCPLLESFELTQLEVSDLEFSAPNLKYMNLNGDYVIIHIKAPLMTEISVGLNSYSNGATYEELRSSVCDYAKCFGGFTNLQKLVGSGYFTKYLSFGIELCRRSLVFHHLKLIDLDNVYSKDAKEMMVVAHLLIGARNLQELKISTEPYWKDDESDADDPDLSFRYLGFAPNFKLEKLTDVSVHFKCLTPEVEFMKFLLESSPALETMNIVLQDGTKETINSLTAKLQGCNWASPTVKLCNGTLAAFELCRLLPQRKFYSFYTG